jgi:hypothetical protein
MTPPGANDAPAREFTAAAPVIQPAHVPDPVPAAAPAPPPQAPSAPTADDSPTQPPKPAQNYTVWSSTPGEGQHFGPKE